MGGESGILNIGLVDSAAQRPQTIVYGHEIFKGCIIKASSLAYALISWHPSMDGNKRTALYSIAIMLQMNNIFMPFPPYLVKYSLLVARQEMSEQQFAAKITKICAKEGSFMHPWKYLRYHKLPIWEVTYLLNTRFTRGRGMNKILDWMAAGDAKTLEKTMEDYSNMPKRKEKQDFIMKDDDVIYDEPLDIGNKKKQK